MKKRKNTKKNLLIVTGTEETPVAEVKSELSNALSGIEISDTRFTYKGKIVIHFADETLRDEAAQKITHVEKLSARPVKKFMPKVTLCNVRKEECEESVKDTTIAKNDYLLTVPEIQTRLSYFFLNQRLVVLSTTF